VYWGMTTTADGRRVIDEDSTDDREPTAAEIEQ
jgi:hypothetical protein